MKKILAILLTVTMMFSLVACGETNNNPTNTPDDTSNVTPSQSITPDRDYDESDPSITDNETKEPTQSDNTGGATDGIRPEFKEAMDSYEAFYTEYCEFMKEYSENPTDLTLLAKYADMLAKAEEMNKAFETWDEDELSNEELKYYLDVNNHVMKMLVDVAG